MKLHEYQAKKILKTFGRKVPYTRIAYKMEETVYLQDGRNSIKYICGIKIANSIKDVYKKASKIIVKKLVTNQTKKKGKIVKKVIILC
ncbi:ATP-grasp domain-containing protein [Candidatus Karelsulcia muelleri]|uniref:ATP-grasp domain-containing protein n=1 Tax=Candidatus Karelsulcia muelleri TaxID=336810 RepID=UPI001EF3D917|nr:ATP-grasp domain-containing protein [Candidatus Karelsulcia muelleri]